MRDERAVNEDHAAKPRSAAQWRLKMRRGEWTDPTPGLAEGYAQANLLIIPSHLADDFEAFCNANPRPCPLLERLPAGDPHTKKMAEADVRTDLPRYLVFVDGDRVAAPTDVRSDWRYDLVTFLLGCSFTFEWALHHAGLPLHHVSQGRNVPMYRTSIPLTPVGPFGGQMVVSMRCFAPHEVRQAAEISARFPRMHGAPIHVGEPSEIGIEDLDRPHFGDAIERPVGSVPVFWPCGVTSQVAALSARPDLAICHAPGHMLLLDRKHAEFDVAL